MANKKIAKIGVIGGSGFYHFLPGKEIEVKTPFGKPSDRILISELGGEKIALLARHGKNHQFPPHAVPYLANIYAFYKLGVERIIATCAVGSLKPKIKPGDFVICDDFFDFTKSRPATFYDGRKSRIFQKVFHISLANPFCPELRKIAIRNSQKFNMPFHRKGKILVIEGPRFSTKNESNFFRKIGDVINMTALPEIVLARELGMCYLNICLATDYDIGLKGRKDIKPVTAKQVLETFKRNNERVKKLILEIIKDLSGKERSCSCGEILQEAEI
jgi:5'-methylthioadenosine phosphorylase